MAVPTSKTELLSVISMTFKRLTDDLARVPESRVHECSMRGHVVGTQISPANLVSYLLGWNELVLKWLCQDDRGESVDFPETGFKWNQLGLLAQKFYTDYQSSNWAELLERLETVKAELVETISNRSDKELYHMSWYGKWPKGRMIQLNTFSPYANVRGRIRKWLKENNI
ncbi:ClbS/DfsB family four-helix bundle protein [Xenorhabdus sp. PB30.3]|uniref:ClbS/DfsB family four-helix bundle protein n=1 Tax=Xenorhabdus sp. PB30.3 TaxID=2788941 RepID=UPI001E2FF93C|nr:ClbS/DfsB family four-helix bundle protein [Xenorhabdus sp. PB30.3]MCC8380073.1 ClbS/DfsB family four-helix bundle protein [Xenorhabdus sp. PB30.3]